MDQASEDGVAPFDAAVPVAEARRQIGLAKVEIAMIEEDIDRMERETGEEIMKGVRAGMPLIWLAEKSGLPLEEIERYVSKARPYKPNRKAKRKKRR